MQELTAARLLTAASTAAKLAGVAPKLLQQLSNTAQLQLPDANSPRPNVMDTARRMSSLSEQLPWQLQQPHSTEQEPDSTGEQASAGVPTAESIEARLGVRMPSLTGAPASEVGSFAEQLQLQQQQQRLGLPRLTDTSIVFGSSSVVGDVGQLQQQQQQQGLGVLRLPDTSSVFGSSSMMGGVGQLQQQHGLGVLRLTDMSSIPGSSSMLGDVGQGEKGDEETAARAAYRQWSESFEAGRVRAALVGSRPLAYYIIYLLIHT